jgi:hypothetical protein
MLCVPAGARAAAAARPAGLSSRAGGAGDGGPRPGSVPGGNPGPDDPGAQGAGGQDSLLSSLGRGAPLPLHAVPHPLPARALLGSCCRPATPGHAAACTCLRLRHAGVAQLAPHAGVAQLAPHSHPQPGSRKPGGTASMAPALSLPGAGSAGAHLLPAHRLPGELRQPGPNQHRHRALHGQRAGSAQGARRLVQVRRAGRPAGQPGNGVARQPDRQG